MEIKAIFTEILI